MSCEIEPFPVCSKIMYMLRADRYIGVSTGKLNAVQEDFISAPDFDADVEGASPAPFPIWYRGSRQKTDDEDPQDLHADNRYKLPLQLESVDSTW